jgi:hypothetical protein
MYVGGGRQLKHKKGFDCECDRCMCAVAGTRALEFNISAGPPHLAAGITPPSNPTKLLQHTTPSTHTHTHTHTHTTHTHKTHTQRHTNACASLFLTAFHVCVRACVYMCAHVHAICACVRVCMCVCARVCVQRQEQGGIEAWSNSIDMNTRYKILLNFVIFIYYIIQYNM